MLRFVQLFILLTKWCTYFTPNAPLIFPNIFGKESIYKEKKKKYSYLGSNKLNQYTKDYIIVFHKEQ